MLLGSLYRGKKLRLVNSMVLCAAVMGVVFVGACAETRTHEASGQYVDDSVISTKVKAAILREPTLKVAEINVETFKGEVQLSGFVSSANDIPTAVRVARQVAGVTSVKNSLQVKH